MMSKHFIFSCYERDEDGELLARAKSTAEQISRWHALTQTDGLSAAAALDQCLSDAQTLLKAFAVPYDGIEVRIGYTFHPGQREQGPTYASGGQPAEPASVEFDSAEIQVDGKWIAAPGDLAKWAAAELEGRCRGDAVSTAEAEIADDEIDARERAAEARAEMRAEDRRL